MSRLDTETKRKLREMNAGELVEAIDTQDETLSISFRSKIVSGWSSMTPTPPSCIRLDERGLNRQLLTRLGTCSFVDRQQNVVFQGFTGSGKSYLGCAIAKRACEHRIRAHYVRMPGLEGAWVAAQDTPRRGREVPPQVCGIHLAGH